MEGLRIRPVRFEEAGALNEIRRQPSVMEFVMSLPSERVTHNRAFLENLGPDDHMLVAELDGQVIGTASLHVGKGRQRHVGTLGIMIHEGWQNRGVGRVLMEGLLDIADNHLGLVRVELEVYVDNARAIHLYESLGFETEGCKCMGIFRRGEYLDVLVMVRIRRVGTV